ncbi:unnamed protein product [Phytophthora lilii]|uniref:Unnamed protein product n=1 Tax=Phytophthora lilii TaxID=2077276 RepID=A0A9W6TBA1_9STRA|nr:unnamed protein product [Phytophthora lilii]
MPRTVQGMHAAFLTVCFAQCDTNIVIAGQGKLTSSSSGITFDWLKTQKHFQLSTLILAMADDDGDDVDEYTLMKGSAPELSSTGERYGARNNLMQLLHEYRALEFSCTVAMFVLALFFAWIPVQQRPIPNVEVQINSTRTVWARDPTLNTKMHTEQVSTEALVLFGTAVPMATNLLMNYVLPSVWKMRPVPHDTRDFLLTLAQSASMSELLTELTKNITGRFRPCFYDMCKWNYDVVWDGETNLCKNAWGEKEGRKSFPSGHASFAWSTMLVLTVREHVCLSSTNRLDSHMLVTLAALFNGSSASQ